MRLNVYIAKASGLSRRGADDAVATGRVVVNGSRPSLGQQVSETDSVALDGRVISLPSAHTTIMLNKPTGYVCSRNGQGSLTIYELLPEKLHTLKPVGRLDKDSSGLLLLTNDGVLANQLTHPSQQKTKIYVIRLDKPLTPLHQQMICDYGVRLEDGNSKFMIQKEENKLIVTMREGRNRQIRRTFGSLGYSVTSLRRTQFGDYHLGDLAIGQHLVV